jgi:hypothetical protein
MRGMKKWLPYKSLVGQYEVLAAMKAKRKEVPKPELSEDETEEISRTLQTLQRNDRVRITYYEDGKIEEREGSFDRFDEFSAKLCLRGFTLALTDLLSLSREN